jgi:S-DNA-T family DNA segregation ATPase FtsK/SpoIIIE
MAANTRKKTAAAKSSAKAPTKAVAKKSPKKSPGILGKWAAARQFWAHPRFRGIRGIFGISLAVFLTGALISGLFTGGRDYLLIAAEGVEMDPENLQPFHNLLGGAGARASFWLSRQGLGLGALALPVWLFLLSWPMTTGSRIAHTGRIFRHSFLAALVLPWALGFLVHLTQGLGAPAWDHAIGASGNFLVNLSLLHLGAWGTGLVLITVILGGIVYYVPNLFLITHRPDASADSDAEIRETRSQKASPVTPAETPVDDVPPWDDEPVEAPKNEPVAPPRSALDEVLDDLLGEAKSEHNQEHIAPIARQPEPSHAAPPEPESEAEPEPEPQPTPTPEQDLEGVSFEVKVANEEEQVDETEIDRKVKEFGEYDPTLELSRFQLPKLDLLVNHGDGAKRVSATELEANKEQIINTLRNFKIEVSKISADVGPTVTLYEIVPAPGVRISKIKNLEDDIALSLSALGIRIIAPIPGRGTIGIEVPNSDPDVVSMRSLIASDKFQKSDGALPIAIGKTISNETYVFDLAKMPHLLMAGATGQGKSVGLNAMLVSMLYRKHPSQLKFVLVDPKKVELTLFNHIERHYLAKLPGEEDAIITDTSKVVATLNSLCVEMDQRYDLLKDAQCRNIKEYNKKFVRRRLNPEEGHRYLPYIVLIVDEFADLIMTAGKEVETPIARLAQLARAIGIHLIIATQRPSVNIITGTIKANFPARIAFRVTSKIDSRTILDAGGADQLIGRGDMLMSTGNDLIRLQCGFVDTPEVEEICEYIGSQQGYPDAFILPEPAIEGGGDGASNPEAEERDAMFEEAARCIVLHQQGSTSLLQRKLKLGYSRAGRIMDQLEHAGVIGPFKGSKAREVLVPDEMSLEQLLQRD